MNNIKKKIVSAITLVSSYSFLAGCATSHNPALEQAQAEIANLQSNPEIATNAPVALYEAKKALTKAESAWDATEDDVKVNHLAYIAKRRAEITQYTANRNMNEAQQKALEEQRQQLALNSKTKDIKQAQNKVKMLEDELMKMKELKPEKTERGLVLTLGDVLFATGKAQLTAGASNNLFKLTTFLNENTDRNILIEGHTDSVGSEDMNLRLSLRRADAVTGFLARNGVDRLRITTKGYGELYPVASNDNATGRQLNRRVELIVLDQGKTANDVRR
ncbi:MAG: OmpA family protein [Methylococcaceae bacterium]|jgi:outer membrane protein OmpA-like peptidoglycan-associated protein